MYTEEELIALEEEERTLTEEEIALMLLLLGTLRSDLENELRKFYHLYGKDGVVTYPEARKWISSKDHRRRLTVLLLWINDSFNTTFEKLYPLFQTMLFGVANKESAHFKTEIDADKLIYKAWGADDKNWEDRLAADVSLWNYNTQNKVKESLLKRITLTEVMEWVEEYFGYMERTLDKLGITESTAYGSIARQEIFKQNGITKYRFYTQADERTCQICGSMHGLEFPISAYLIGSTASPLHPRCRCFEIPISD